MNSGYEYREQLPPAARGLTAVEWLARTRRHSDAATWQDRVARGEVWIDGRVAVAADHLAAGQWLAWRRPPWEEPVVPLGFGVVFLDPELLAVAKPQGLPSNPAGGFLEHTLLARVRRRFPEAAPLHRLGRGTSGLVLFARTEAARRHVAAQWRDGRVEKEYRALVAGQPREDRFTVDAPIGPVPHPRLGSVHAASAAGRPALSHVHVLGPRDGAALVSVAIPTGRPHQIRIHLAAAGHPLVGDPLYAPGGGFTPEAAPGETGYWLHAHRLALVHPATGARLELECLPPPALR
ncbi:MAG: RluA family pseudouridine synthase [Vicinamibacteria bacterium]